MQSCSPAKAAAVTRTASHQREKEEEVHDSPAKLSLSAPLGGRKKTRRIHDNGRGRVDHAVAALPGRVAGVWLPGTLRLRAARLGHCRTGSSCRRELGGTRQSLGPPRSPAAFPVTRAEGPQVSSTGHGTRSPNPFPAPMSSISTGPEEGECSRMESSLTSSLCHLESILHPSRLMSGHCDFLWLNSQ